jgi:hypothetical protein
MTTNEQEIRFFTVENTSEYKCFYEIPKSEACFLHESLNIEVDTQYVKTKPIRINAK